MTSPSTRMMNPCVSDENWSIGFISEYSQVPFLFVSPTSATETPYAAELSDTELSQLHRDAQGHNGLLDTVVFAELTKSLWQPWKM